MLFFFQNFGSIKPEIWNFEN